MTLTDNQEWGKAARMTPEIRALFDILPPKLQAAYMEYWETRLDLHGAHRDTLPAFVAGVFVGMG